MGSEAILSPLRPLVGSRLLTARHLIYLTNRKVRPRKWIVALELSFKEQSLYVTVNSDTDTLETGIKAPKANSKEQWVDAAHLKPWCLWLGKPLQFVWACMNHMGFVDGLQLGFDQYRPVLSLLAVTSSIREYVISEPEPALTAAKARTRRVH